MGEGRARREFRRESFGCVRDWVHFIAEFELRPCGGCRERARIPIGAPADWRCSACTSGSVRALPLHPDLWRAIAEGVETRTRCPICRGTVALGDCWVSEDGRRLYCAHHLRPIATPDRLRRARIFLGRSTRRETSPAFATPARLTEAGGDGTRFPLRRLSTLAAHFEPDRCARCPHNGRAVYDGDRLVEVDRDRARCTSAPDALNCADIDH